MIGELVGSYRITQPLGSGGMGVVYAAEHVVLASKAAVKMLQPRHSADQEVVTRFFNEARAATRIKHPGIVAVFDFGHHASGSAYLVMELLEGETLGQRLKRVGRLSWREALVLARQIAGALGAAHAAGIVHRDLKPHNLFLVRDADVTGGERVKVLDFGIAKLAVEKSSGDSHHTREGALLGTPKYMAPEQCRGAGRVDARADVYSLGCVMFALVCGEPPFSGEGNGDVMAKQIYEPPPRPSDQVPGLDLGFEDLVLRCLQKDPSARPASMRAVSDTIDELLRSDDRDAASSPQLPPARTAGPGSPTITATSTPGPVQAAPTPEPAASARWAQNRQVTTTLGASAAELSRTKPPKDGATTRPWRAAAAVLAVLIAGGAAALWRQVGSGSEVTTRPPAPVEVVASAPVLIETPDAAPAPVAAPPAPARVTLSITSQPPGAAVVRIADGEWVGQSPLTLRLLPAEGEAEFAVRLRGYRERRVKLRTDVDGTAHVVLERERVRPDAHAPAAQPAAATPAKPADDEHVGDGTLDPFGAGEASP